MKPLFTVIDEFLEKPMVVAKTARDAGFGNWVPASAEVGSGKYEGMGWVGAHAAVVRGLSQFLGVVIPNKMFFRETSKETERAYVHSDRMTAPWTSIVYLSQHEEVSGTAFFRHRKYGFTEMPTFEVMQEQGIFEEMKEDMVSASPEKWEQTDFVRGLYNRALIFHAPLFHSRFPLGAVEDGKPRLVHVCHFFRE